ncbi:uncharacterized protein BX664DRAFT_332523 [Halteromyces radiatus]|uniref:uncharacterized protein n=1 Tax=Halteromyces radiatus TaxID=101107 RepID=UPI00221F75C7|nr:uncharacterized protein BX664DRAFT_332523 [Halteromyces radiatus]KAI8089249.1 hypothetical protein BX664DRAFT_332523 [Halteromyces radiatus]
MPNHVRPSPSFGSPIYVDWLWNEGQLPIEFMTIQRQQHPTLSTDNDATPSIQNNTIRQTYQALDMDFNFQQGYRTTAHLFRYSERLLQARCLTAQEIRYYQKECKIRIPDPLSNSTTASSSSSSMAEQKEFDRRQEQLQQKWEEQVQSTGKATGSGQQQQQQIDTDCGGHIFINVCGVTDLIINEKWMIMQGN